MTYVSPAETLLKSFGITTPEEIDLEAIAWECGAEVIETQLDGYEAQIIGNGNQAKIIIAKNKSLERKRFSIGHELGHWEHHKGKTFVCRAEDIGSYKPYSYNDPERVADRYAADITMPQYIFQPLANLTAHASFKEIKNLAYQFSTSITATALRYVDYSPEPTMLICHGIMGRKWFKHGKDVPSNLFPLDQLDHESFAMDVLHSNSEQTYPKIIDADAWFDKRDASQFELYEETVKIHSNLTLTLLSWRNEDMLARYA